MKLAIFLVLWILSARLAKAAEKPEELRAGQEIQPQKHYKIPLDAKKGSGAAEVNYYWCHDHGSFSTGQYQCIILNPNGEVLLYGEYALFHFKRINGELKFEKSTSIVPASEIGKIGYDSGGISAIYLNRGDLVLVPFNVSAFLKDNAELRFSFVEGKVTNVQNNSGTLISNKK